MRQNLSLDLLDLLVMAALLPSFTITSLGKMFTVLDFHTDRTVTMDILITTQDKSMLEGMVSFTLQYYASI